MKLSWVEAIAAMEDINTRNLDYDRKRFIVKVLLHALAQTEGEVLTDCLISRYDLHYNSEGAHPYFDKTKRKPLDPTPGPHGEYYPPSKLSDELMREIAKAVKKETIRNGSYQED